MRWASWGGQAGFGSGIYNFKVCSIGGTCKTVTFPILAALWRVKPLPSDHAVHYFTRMTVIFTGNRAYKSAGKTFHEPQTLTFPLSASGGAG